MTLPQYLANLARHYASGIAREHAYRPDFQNLLRALLPADIDITNEPANVTDCGNPDFLLTRSIRSAKSGGDSILTFARF